MKVYVNKITGIDDAIVSMFMSRRTWTRELEMEVRDVCECVLDKNGYVRKDADPEKYANFSGWMDKLTKWGKQHITMLRFINFSVTVEGLHRGGQDDWDAHARRYENRIIRSSTRMSQFGYEMSDFYKDKILPTDMALEILGVQLPEKFEHNGKTYVKRVNGYIEELYADDKDVQRGLYMLSIPSNFIFDVNLTEWAHVYKERNSTGRAHPEVKECAEAIAFQLAHAVPWFNWELFLDIKN